MSYHFHKCLLLFPMPAALLGFFITSHPDHPHPRCTLPLCPLVPFLYSLTCCLDKLCFRRYHSTVFTEKPKFILTCRTPPDLTTICLSRLFSLCLSHSRLLAVLQTNSSESAFLISLLLFLSPLLDTLFPTVLSKFCYHPKSAYNSPYTAKLPQIPLSPLPSLLSRAFGIAAQLA